MRKTILAVMLALMVTPALAQDGGISLSPSSGPKDPVKAEREKELDNAYRKALKSIPDAKTKSDPWGSTRQAPTSAQMAPR